MREFINNLKFTWKYAKNEKYKIIKYTITNLIDVIISVVVPILSAKIIVALTSNLFYQVVLIGIVLFIVNFLWNVVGYLGSFYTQYIYRESFVRIQTDLGRNILKLENKIIDSKNSGVFIQRLTNDTSRIADIFGVLNTYLRDILTSVGIFFAIFIINKQAFLYFAVMVIVLFIIEKLRVNTYNENDKKYRKKSERVSGFVSELVRGIRDIKMLNAEDSFIKELQGKVVDLNNERYNMSDVNRKYFFLRHLSKDVFELFLIILLVYLIINNRLEVATALVIHNYFNRFTMFATYLGQLLEKVKDFNLSASRIYAIINNDEFKKEKFGKKHLDKIEGNFEFKNVTFSYDKVKVLDNLNFKVNANETVAFVGKTGVGKSTIFNLLCKMYDVKKGQILIDGINIKKLDKDSIRGNITVISQNPYIFNLSIKDNFRLVKEDVTFEEMVSACKMACLDKFINKLPDKYDTIIGEGGVNLSGGQKQRMAIARALIQKTEIILFDEATSALDNETQKQIQEAIDNIKNEYTILIVAHRLSTIINASRILYLEDGKIEAEGTHEELLKNCPKYKKLYESELIRED